MTNANAENEMFDNAVCNKKWIQGRRNVISSAEAQLDIIKEMIIWEILHFFMF